MLFRARSNRPGNRGPAWIMALRVDVKSGDYYIDLPSVGT